MPTERTWGSSSPSMRIRPIFTWGLFFLKYHRVTLSLIGGKYKPLILWHLIDHPLHYMELQRLISNATPKMLSQQLHDLENNGMIHREVIPEKPPKTVYSLTPFGQSIVPILDAMCQWGNNYLDGLDVQPPCCQSRK